MWPPRDAICLDCRTALSAGQPCPGGRHRVKSLREPAGREALLDEVWGPKPMRRRLREATRAGAIGSPGVGLLDGCGSCDLLNAADDVRILAVLVVAFIAIVAIWFAVKLVIELVRRHRNRLRANGAGRPGPRFGRAFARGKVAAGATEIDPVTKKPAVAFGIQLREPRRGVMLRDGATIGFTVELDSGECVNIPAGACAIDASYGNRVSLDAAYSAAIDPLRNDDDLDPFPGTEARLVVIAPGDRVEIHGALVPAPAPGETGYRDARVVLVPDGVAKLRAA